ncbi:T9SS type A sorting domain-containing protein [Panacibacter sp. KCS-6]|uniref:Aminopeptidase N n=2 Tax=Limnovirga soli TaxID=2656915 RepID=A0A8J8FJE7_9BACT|nr:T9SS type A sorting domain-containing protein [Limnovirga soli]
MINLLHIKARGMKKLLSGFLLTVLTGQILAQEQVCKEVNTIAAMEKLAKEKRFKPVSLTLASNNYNVYYYKCEWTIDPAVYYISGKVSPSFTITNATNNLVFDLSDALRVDSVYMRKKKLNFVRSGNATVTVQLPKTYGAGKKDSITFYYQGAPVGGGFGSFIQSTHNSKPVLWTLSEPYGASDWWPCRNGLDDKADSIDIYITHPGKYKASSNGMLQSVAKQGKNATSYFKHRYPIASYLVALAVTNYTTATDFVQLGNTQMPVISNIYPEDSASFHAAITPVLNGLQLFSNTFTLYPFAKEKYGQTQFGWGGGMEHQTNSYVIGYGENLQTHELAHQWFGDKITCGSWEDIWLNEGFATFCADFLYTENYNPAQNKINIKANLDYIVSQPGGSVKVDDTTNINRIFDGRLSYDKGAFLLRMLRFTMGDSLFFTALRNYLEDPQLKYNFARTANLQHHLEAVSGLNLTYFFNQWYQGQGYPSFTVKWSQNGLNQANINISQVTSHPSVSFFQVPLALTFKNATQQKTIIVQHTINNQIVIDNIGFKADTVLIDPENYLISKNNKAIKQAPLAKADNLLQISVSPNPFTNRLSVMVNDSDAKKLLFQLFDNAGQLMFSTTAQQNVQHTYTLQTPAHLLPGNYVLKVIANNKTNSYNVIKK